MLNAKDRFFFRESFESDSVYSNGNDFCFIEGTLSQMEDKKKLEFFSILSGIYNNGGGCLFNGLKKEGNDEAIVIGMQLKDQSDKESYTRGFESEITKAFAGIPSKSVFQLDLVPVVDKVEGSSLYQQRFVLRITATPLPSSPLAFFDFPCACSEEALNAVFSMKWNKGKLTSLTSKDISQLLKPGNLNETASKALFSSKALKEPFKGPFTIKAQEPSNQSLDCLRKKEEVAKASSPKNEQESKNWRSQQYIETLPKCSTGFRGKSNSVFIPPQPVALTLLEMRAKQEQAKQQGHPEQRKPSDTSFSTDAMSEDSCSLEPVARSAERPK